MPVGVVRFVAGALGCYKDTRIRFSTGSGRENKQIKRRVSNGFLGVVYYTRHIENIQCAVLMAIHEVVIFGWTSGQKFSNSTSQM